MWQCECETQTADGSVGVRAECRRRRLDCGCGRWDHRALCVEVRARCHLLRLLHFLWVENVAYLLGHGPIGLQREVVREYLRAPSGMIMYLGEQHLWHKWFIGGHDVDTRLISELITQKSDVFARALECSAQAGPERRLRMPS